MMPNPNWTKIESANQDKAIVRKYQIPKNRNSEYTKNTNNEFRKWTQKFHNLEIPSISETKSCDR